MTLICLSPHLDDAVLSAGAFLAERRLKGDSVLVLNVFSASAEAYAPAAWRFQPRASAAERHQEELSAMAVLGIAHQDLGFLDAPFRDRRYRAYPRLFGSIPAWEESGREALAAVERIARERGATRILAPLAVGDHIDHRLVHELGRALESAFEVAYYEDMPYALVPHALTRRLRDLGMSTPGRQPPVSAVARAVRAHHARNPLYRARPAWQRALASLALGAWTTKVERASRAHPGTSTAPLLHAELATVSAEAFARKLAALACYESQLPLLFASLPAAEEAYRSYAAHLESFSSRYAERFWLSRTWDCGLNA
jgi:LmbE family N-acetylglucosaminyl deacetylase